MFIYLNETFVIYNFDHDINDIVKYALFRFKEQFSVNGEVLKEFYEALCQQINMERLEHENHSRQVKDLVEMMYALDLFMDPKVGLQSAYLNRTRTHYQQMATKFTKDSKFDVAQYIEQIELNNKLEIQRNENFIDKITCAEVSKILNSELIAALFNKKDFELEFTRFIENNQMDLIKKIYKLAQIINRIDAVSDAFQINIQTKVSCLTQTHSKNEYTLFVEELINLHCKYKTMVSELFDNNELIKNTMKNKFETLININCIYFSSALVKYIDNLLRNPKEATVEFDAQIEPVLYLFRYLSGKDVFEAKYKQSMINRLLFIKNQNLDREKELINKLKDVCGRSFTYKLEGMINDINLSKDISDTYNNAENKSHLFKFKPLILTKGFWPKLPNKDIIVPEEMKREYEAFKTHYLRTFKSRKLEQCNTLDTLNLKCSFKNNTTKQFEVSLYQALILFCFNDADSLTFDNIFLLTRIDHKILKKELFILSNNKCQILIKKEKKDAKTIYLFNEHFQFPNSKIIFTKSQLINKKDKEFEKEAENDGIVNRALETIHYIELAIMRVMKQYKKAALSQIIEHTIKETSLSITIDEIKERLDQLIERDFIKKTENDAGIYEYIA